MRLTALFSIALLLALTSCNKEELIDSKLNEEQQQTMLPDYFYPIQDGSAKNLPRPQIWGFCDLYVSVVTPASFKPTAGNFDELYINPNGFSNGIPLISDAVPGNNHFNGGRWHVNMLKAGVDPAKYENTCSVMHLDLADFMSTDNYFECPMLPRRNGVVQE